MRSFAELAFRARQEAANLYLLASQPKFGGNVQRFPALPDAQASVDALAGSAYAEWVETLAGKIVDHHFPILGLEFQAGQDIQWRRDYVHQKQSGTEYFRRIPYLDFDAVGDHKFIWELNRHQHLILLAQAYRFTRREEFLDEILKQLESWIAQNAFQCGINWTSALEVAFRTLSWIWVYHLVGSEMSSSVQQVLFTGLYRHGLHLSENLSVYFSPNTHLLGEAVALHALATLFPDFPGARRWREKGSRIVLEQLEFQVHRDGSHFEQSTYYHVYALDFFVLFYLLSGRPSSMVPALLRMAEYVFWLLGPSREISFFGDDDGGRLFHPYGLRNRFGRASLATCGVLFGCEEWLGTSEDLAEQAAWWVGPEVFQQVRQVPAVCHGNRIFADSGTLFLQNSALSLQMDCGPFGFGGAGHSHSDTFSFTLRSADENILVDPGTYAYMGDPGDRNWFRGSRAHNTVRVNGKDQAEPQGPFRWSSKPEVTINKWRGTADGGAVDAYCRYNGIRHRRRLLLEGSSVLVLDEVEGRSELACEQIWQLGNGAND